MRNILSNSIIHCRCYRPWLIDLGFNNSGTKHWLIERGTSVAVFSLLGATFLYPCQYVDHALNIVLPLHCHIGFDSILTDYVPKYKYRWSNKFFFYALYAATGATAYGLYKFNTNGIGLSRALNSLYSKSHQ